MQAYIDWVRDLAIRFDYRYNNKKNILFILALELKFEYLKTYYDLTLNISSILKEKKQVKVVFYYKFFTTQTLKAVQLILVCLEKYQKSGCQIIIYWHYPVLDDDHVESVGFDLAHFYSSLNFVILRGKPLI